jgi:pyridoxal phosphate enzyme (YggS family)
LAVSKTQSIGAIQEAYQCGQTSFGESYLQEALPKIHALEKITANNTANNIEWHFIGPIQKNKTRGIAESFSWVHSIDRKIIAQRLHEQRPSHLPPLNICIQVNISHEASKSGILPEEALALAQLTQQSYSRLILRGLMVIPESSQDIQQQHHIFREAKKLFDQINAKLIHPMDTLSMGMSNDYPAAIAEGATIIRIGTELFGKRKS